MRLLDWTYGFFLRFFLRFDGGQAAQTQYDCDSSSGAASKGVVSTDGHKATLPRLAIIVDTATFGRGGADLRERR